LCLGLSWDHKRKTLSPKDKGNWHIYFEGRRGGVAGATMPPNETANRKKSRRGCGKKTWP